MQLRRIFAGAIATGTLLMAAGCAGDDLAEEDSGEQAGGGVVRISGQAFPEAELMANMYALVLEDAGYDPDVKLVDTRDVYMADFPDNIDVVPEYVGAVVDFLNTTTNGADAQSLTTSDAAATITAAKDLLAQKEITLLDPSAATDTNAFFVAQDFSEKFEITKLSDLKGRKIVLAAAPDCEGRADCEGGLSEVYGIKITKVLPLGFASDQTYQSVISGESELGLTSTTDGTLASQGLVLLEDDLAIQPAQNLVPAVSDAFLADNPEVEGVLNELMAALTTEKLTELNGRISVDREKSEDVARDFLTEAGLL